MKVKKILLIGLMVVGCLFTSGCTTDNMDNIEVIVTNYSTEFIMKELYDEHANITSIYPDGVDIDNYTISDKQKEDYSKTDLFIYNGLIEKERELAVDLLGLNPDLKIIDTAYVLETEYSPEELWLNPSSLLMMAQNVRIGLEEYISSTYLQKEVEAAYEALKITLSELDADYRLTIESTDNHTIVVANSALKFLEKFGLEVYCIDSDATDKTISDVENLIKDEEISYIYSFKEEELSDKAQKLVDAYSSVKVEELHKLDNLSDDERSEKEDYLSIMNDNLDLLKQELYQ